MNKKIKKLIDVNNHITERIKHMDDEISQYGDKNLNFNVKINYQNQNDDTKVTIIDMKKNMKSNILFEEDFKRIICVKGKIKINLIFSGEDVYLSPPNTYLILPETKYTIESLDNSELIIIDKPKKEGKRFRIREEESIYKKI